MFTESEAKFQIVLMQQKWIDRGQDMSLVRVMKLKSRLTVQVMSYDDCNWHEISDRLDYGPTFEAAFVYIKKVLGYSGTVEVQP